jgi:hypothetical protein
VRFFIRRGEAAAAEVRQVGYGAKVVAAVNRPGEAYGLALEINIDER